MVLGSSFHPISGFDPPPRSLRAIVLTLEYLQAPQSPRAHPGIIISFGPQDKIAFNDSFHWVCRCGSCIGHGYVRHRAKRFNCDGSTVYGGRRKKPAALDVTQNETDLHWLPGPKVWQLSASRACATVWRTWQSQRSFLPISG